MIRVKSWPLFVLLISFGIPFLTQMAIYPFVPFQMFSQNKEVKTSRFLILGYTHCWITIVPDASFGQTKEWDFMLARDSKNADKFLKEFAKSKQGMRYKSTKFISIHLSGDTLTLAKWKKE